MIITTVIVVIESALILGLIVLLIVQQVRGQYMDRRRLWGTPMILAAVGIVYLPLTVRTFVPADALFLGIEVLVSVGIGVGLGALTTTQVADTADRRGRLVQIRSGWWGGALWIVFIAARLALQPLATSLNARLVTSAGVILILAAAARAVMAVIVAPRLARAEGALDRQPHPEFAEGGRS